MLVWAGGGAAAVMSVVGMLTYLGVDPLPYPKKEDYERYQQQAKDSLRKESERIDSLLVQMEVAANDRTDLRRRSLVNEQLHVQNQIWQAEREKRFYENKGQPVPDSIKREIENNVRRHLKIQQDIDKLQ